MATRVNRWNDKLEACEREPGTCPRCGSPDAERRRTYWIECMGEITCAHKWHDDPTNYELVEAFARAALEGFSPMNPDANGRTPTEGDDDG